MIYGKSDTLDMDRIIDMLQAFEKFVAVKDDGDGRFVATHWLWHVFLRIFN